MTHAILLVGHGTRNETGQRQFLRWAEYLRAAVTAPVEVAYIELQSPTIEVALVRLHERGIRKVILCPALLFAAGHAKHDIPSAVTAAHARCPDLQVKIAEPLGCHEAVLQLAALRVSHSLASVPRGEVRGEGPELQTDPATTLVLIGRGSSDPTAIEHCREFAAQVAVRLKIEKVHTGFIAIAQPSLPAVLELAAADNPQRVIVLPHLLFQGEMLETTTAAVSAARAAYPQIDWRQADNLGSDLLSPDSSAGVLLVQSLLARFPPIGD